MFVVVRCVNSITVGCEYMGNCNSKRIIRQWLLRVSPEEDKFLVDMLNLFYKLGLVKKLSKAEFLRYCVLNTCKQVISILKEGQYGRITR